MTMSVLDTFIQPGSSMAIVSRQSGDRLKLDDGTKDVARVLLVGIPMKVGALYDSIVLCCL